MHFRHHIVSPIVNYKSHWLELIPSVNFFRTCNRDWHVSALTSNILDLMPYLMRLCVPHASEFHNTTMNFVGDSNDATWSSSLEILNVFHFCFSWFSIHIHSRDIKSFVRYLHMQRQLHLLPLWECWKEKLRCTIVFPLLHYVTQTPQLLLMFGHFCFMW